MDKSAKDWLLLATSDLVYFPEYNRFMAAYIALNHLYGYKRGDERKQMVNYLSSHCNGINPFELDVSEYLSSPIQDMRPGENNSIVVTPGDRDSLFNAIYQVRCNLFHGDKLLGSDRDKRLAQQGADVIIKILSQMLDTQEENERN